jgi:hypothetical protein
MHYFRFGGSALGVRIIMNSARRDAGDLLNLEEQEKPFDLR